MTNTTSADNSRFSDRVDLDTLEWKHDHNRSSLPRAVTMAAECRRRLTEATNKIANQTNPSTRGLILSGGVDTCAILEAAASQGITFALAITVVIGDDTSPDELYAQYAAYKHGLKHVIVRMTAAQLIDVHLPKTIKTLQVWDGMTIRNSLVISAAFEAAQQHGLTDVLVGDGADELFGGYTFTWGKAEDPVGWKDKRDKMCQEWTFATDDLAHSYGLVAHAPYEDQEYMVDWALAETQREDCIADNRCEIQLILGGPYQVHTTGKVLLREAFDTGSSWRRKDPIEVGSGATVIGKNPYWENIISDDEFAMEKARLKKEEGITIPSKEYLTNIRTYVKVFGGIVHPTKKRLPEGEGCVGCRFEIGDSMFCHMCGAWPAQRWKVLEMEKASQQTES